MCLSRTLSSSQTETLYPTNKNFIFSSLLPAPGHPDSTFVSVNLTTAGTSYKSRHRVFIFLRLAYSCNITVAGLILVVGCVRVSLLKGVLHTIPLYGCATFCLAIRSSVSGRSGRSHLLTSVSNAAVSIRTSRSLLSNSGYAPRSGIVTWQF